MTLFKKLVFIVSFLIFRRLILLILLSFSSDNFALNDMIFWAFLNVASVILFIYLFFLLNFMLHTFLNL